MSSNSLDCEGEEDCAAGVLPGNRSDYMWFKENADDPHEVGLLGENQFGLFDMHGNVWEYCRDYRHDNYVGAPTDGSAWLTGKGRTYLRMARGGAYNMPAYWCRSADRWEVTDYGHGTAGFRLVMELP